MKNLEINIFIIQANEKKIILNKKKLEVNENGIYIKLKNEINNFKLEI